MGEQEPNKWFSKLEKLAYDPNRDGVWYKREKTELKNPNVVANIILFKHNIIYSAGYYYEYYNGYYNLIQEEVIKKYIKDLLGGDYSKHRAGEVLNCIQTDRFVKPEALNDTKYLNLKNGLFDLETEILKDHTPDVYSTIRLNVGYSPNASCEKWLKTLDDIFEGNKDKIAVLQEFFGLCLTKETKYQKALFLLGEGSNGKSTLLYVLEHIVGKKNKTSIPMEALSNSHYVANLFNILVNISIEVGAKSAMQDAMFKAVVSGESITADAKYGHPFDFRPHCKLIYALNNVPRVDDKTDAYFRRLIVLKLNRQFVGESDNKDLKYELVKEERDGIFKWCLEGLKRLRQRGDFAITEVIEKEVTTYRREHNNVLMFVDEVCEIRDGVCLTKQELYNKYVEYCKANGYKSVSKNKFGREILKHYPVIREDRTSSGRVWWGITVPE